MFPTKSVDMPGNRIFFVKPLTQSNGAVYHPGLDSSVLAQKFKD